MANNKVGHSLVSAWYHGSAWLYLLWPVSLLYRLIMLIRQCCYNLGFFKRYQAPLPVIVVGNITVGGTGKTPMVIALIKALVAAGLKPAVISRGYGSHAPHYPYLVSRSDNATTTGDEPLLIAQSIDCPVMIGADRKQSIELMISQCDCDVIVTDDGLQHYALKRDFEIAIIDGDRLFGNGHCLPMGPLREPVNRLKRVNWVVSNGATDTVSTHMLLQPSELIRLTSNEHYSAESWPFSKQVHAIAGIGNPSRFFNTLRELGFEPIEHAFTDHHQFIHSDIQFNDDLAVVMTSKDAVKIKPFASDNCWSLPVNAYLPDSFMSDVVDKVQRLIATR